MAVHVIPNRERGWGDYIGMALSQLLGHHLQGKQQEQAYKHSQQVAQEDMYRKQAEQDMIGQVIQDITARGGTDASNPQAYQAGMYEVGARYPHMAPYAQGMAQQANPHKTFQTVDLGDRKMYGGFDPRTGDILNAVMEQMGVDPTTKYGEDAATSRTRIAEGGASSRNAANVGLGYAQLDRMKALDEAANFAYGSPIQTADGELIFPRQSDGTIKRTGIVGPDPLANRRRQGLRTTQLEDGTIALVDPETGEITPTGYKGQQKSSQNDTIAALIDSLGNDPGGKAQAPQPVPGADMEAKIAQMMQITGKPREEVVAYLQSKGMF